MAISISFWGSPPLSVKLLENLLCDTRFKVEFVVTQPDRSRSNRGRKIESSPVKLKAQENKIPVFTPENLKESKFQNKINCIAIRFHVVLAYGQIIPKVIFDHPPLGAINFHASLLPLLRGAAPIEFALWESHLKTGWSLQRITSKLDAGDIIAQIPLDIAWEDHQYLLHTKMENILLNFANDMVYNFSKETKNKIQQSEDLATYSKKIYSIDGEMKWNKSALDLRNQARALEMKPGIFSFCRGKKIKIFLNFSVKEKIIFDQKYVNELPGNLLIKENELWVICGDYYALPISSIQISGRPKISATDFINGYMSSGSILTLSS